MGKTSKKDKTATATDMSLVDRIKSVLQEHPTQEFSYRDLVKALDYDKPDSIRVTCAKLKKSGKLRAQLDQDRGWLFSLAKRQKQVQLPAAPSPFERRYAVIIRTGANRVDHESLIDAPEFADRDSALACVADRSAKGECATLVEMVQTKLRAEVI